MRVAVCDDEQVYTALMADHLELICRMQAIDIEILRYTDPALLLQDQQQEKPQFHHTFQECKLYRFCDCKGNCRIS